MEGVAAEYPNHDREREQVNWEILNTRRIDLLQQKSSLRKNARFPAYLEEELRQLQDMATQRAIGQAISVVPTSVEETPEPTPKRRGRPKGSKNKEKNVQPTRLPVRPTSDMAGQTSEQTIPMAVRDLPSPIISTRDRPLEPEARGAQKDQSITLSLTPQELRVIRAYLKACLTFEEEEEAALTVEDREAGDRLIARLEEITW
jgi:hypothetical protein